MAILKKKFVSGGQPDWDYFCVPVGQQLFFFLVSFFFHFTPSLTGPVGNHVPVDG